MRSVLVLATLACLGLPSTAQTVDRTTLSSKVMCGYQGWHCCPGDGLASWFGWNHWSEGASDYIGPGHYHCEIWPDVREYDASDLFFVPNTTLIQGGTPYLFSDARQGAVNVHFRWMQENHIDGVFHQVFVGGYNPDPNDDNQRKLDIVLQNVMNAASTYGRAFAVEYDISGVADADIYNKLTGHWSYICSAFNIKNHPRYLYHNGKPVVVVWGFGFNDDGHPGTYMTARSVIDWFKANGCFIIGGVPGKWRTLDGDSRSGTAWRDTYRMFNGLTPWTVGRYSTASEITTWKSRVISDISACNTYGQLYMPTAWPRFGWDNMHNYTCGTSKISSRGGQHFWDQVYAWKSAGATCQFIAMFDEYDEGTAIMKLADNVPTTGCWITTEGKGEDWFLRLANYAGKMQRGEIPTSGTIPVSSSTSPDNAQIIGDSIPTTMVAQQEYTVSVTLRNTGETCWNSEIFKLGGVGDSDPFTSNRQNLPAGTAVLPNGQHTFTFMMTAPAAPGTYTSDWQMVHEFIRWFGGTLAKQITVTSGPDTIAPRPVSDFIAAPGESVVSLSWRNSPSPDTTGTMIRCRTDGYPTSPTDGTLVVDKPGSPGAVESFTHTGVTDRLTYYYSAFAYDSVPNYATGSDASATPVDSIPPVSGADKPSGAYKSPLVVHLSASETATIHYTTDGADPNSSSPVYASSVVIGADATLKFYAVDAAGNVESPFHSRVYKVITSDGSIAALKQQAHGSPVRLGDKLLYWKIGTTGYLEEPDRVCAIRVYGVSLPDPAKVCLTGVLKKISAYESRIDVDTITASGPVVLQPVGVSIASAKSVAMTGMNLKLWGTVKPGSVTPGSFVLVDGSDSTGITVPTSYASGGPVVAGEFVSVSGIRALSGTTPILTALHIVHY